MARSDIMEHTGEMLDLAIDQMVASNADHRSWITKIARFAKLYVQNGSHGTQAERRAAMLTVKRKIFEKVTGKDPDVDTHYMEHHWFPDAEADE